MNSGVTKERDGQSFVSKFLHDCVSAVWVSGVDAGPRHYEMELPISGIGQWSVIHSLAIPCSLDLRVFTLSISYKETTS